MNELDVLAKNKYNLQKQKTIEELEYRKKVLLRIKEDISESLQKGYLSFSCSYSQYDSTTWHEYEDYWLYCRWHDLFGECEHNFQFPITKNGVLYLNQDYNKICKDLERIRNGEKVILKENIFAPKESDMMLIRLKDFIKRIF